MNLDNLETFIYVVHFGTFQKAAEALYLTQPSITARIRSLEHEVGTTLFNREGKKVHLTESGKKLVPYAEKILNLQQEATYKLKQNLFVPDQIRIGCSNSISNYVIPEVLPELRRAFPKMKINIISNHSEEIINKILNRDVDFGVIRSTHHQKLESKMITSSAIGLYAHPEHPLISKNRSVTVQEIFEYDLIFYDHNSVEWLFVTRLFEPLPSGPNVIVEVDSMETSKRLVAKGMGICFLPELSVHEELRSNILARVPLETNLESTMQISVMYLKEKADSPALQFFSNFNFHNREA
ncbi:LysR family transcriptional regulator [Paenibacillus eucommiae]|uniref:DNA-binding transcriptional LysR family regulator n=1 Tax=Paenibacillus eucommiae TaxID=1355755 RepID=A0ABS4ISB3_9BACL|nr:LysR family transcriptional regulator [Paenibacillus eucommiae]MBP1990456.1 DNA-binding transcriptional LysR family regulator [Paenibacillus eucommiae]